MTFTTSLLRIISHLHWARVVSLSAGSLAVFGNDGNQKRPSKFTITTAPTRARCRDPDHGRLIIRPTVQANGSFEIETSAERRDVIKGSNDWRRA
jgi:hypothetical protein